MAYKADKIGIDIKGKDIFALKAAYNRYRAEQTAKKAGFVKSDSTADLKAYNKNMREQTAKKVGFINADGTQIRQLIIGIEQNKQLRKQDL
ncbi:hypothetical protein [Rickettsia endosymbiont of Gonocerus acuteangulatus]|uniref:hypothetical protein n=1 Tax=Rickettsia endosymbiont of Gonocerus acuteangulatus TaxID=3066266 RepID=UPI003132C758